MNFLNLPLLARVRRNHAMEHATIHVLTTKYRPLKIVGRSTFKGFYLYGDLSTNMVATAAHEALSRLRAGEHHLAVHPNCGTNLVTAGSLAGLATFAALSGKKKHSWDRLPNALLAATAALIMAQPLGPLLQAHVTTMANVGGLVIKDVRREEHHNVILHFVETG